MTWHSSPRQRPYDDNRDDSGRVGKNQEASDYLSGNDESSNGIRVWYDSYTTIDWIHDLIKASARRRRILRLKGLRGTIVRGWDRLQAWLIISLTGVFTALIAGAIVESEAVLFDFKDGYCSKDWRLAKRFCCPYGNNHDWDGDPISLSQVGRAGRAARSKGWGGPVATSPFWSLKQNPAPAEDVNCPGWVRWADLLTPKGQDSWWTAYACYVLVGILWALIAGALTVYLTSSDLYASSKTDTTFEKPDDAIDNESVRERRRSASAGDAGEDTPLLSGDASSSRRPYSANQRDGQPNGNSSPPQRSSHVKQLFEYSREARANAASPPRKVLFFGSGSGISEIKCILSGFVIHGYLGIVTLFVKSVGLTLSVASGLSLGKEGPFVHIASCVGNIICRFFDKYDRNEALRREILSCACAAGVAVAFGAPVGGVLFSLEEVSTYFSAKVMFRSFFCAMVAATGLRFIDPFGTGQIVLFQVSYDKDWAFEELPFFVLIGAFGGLYGALFTRLNLLWSKNIRAKTWMARFPLLEVIMITGITTMISFLNGYTRMGGPELITDLFSECHEHENLDGLCIREPSQVWPLVSSIGWTLVAKGLLTIVTFGIKLPAGIFIPSLVVGACFGRIVGLLVQWLQWTEPHLNYFSWCPASEGACIVPGIYAMVGAAATLSGVTRTTVSLAVIMFELTGTLRYSIPVMVSILVAKTLADWLEHRGIYDLVIDLSGLPYLNDKETFSWSGTSVRDAMDTSIEYISLQQENTVESLQRKIERLALGLGYTDGGFPIVVPQGRKGVRMVGYIAAQELEHGLTRLLQKKPNERPDKLVCSFAYLPGVAGNPDEEHDGQDSSDDEALKNSTLLAAAGPEDLSRYVDKA